MPMEWINGMDCKYNANEHPLFIIIPFSQAVFIHRLWLMEHARDHLTFSADNRKGMWDVTLQQAGIVFSSSLLHDWQYYAHMQTRTHTPHTLLHNG
jgi:hypothetical protein